jgi:hypothetical protein
MKIGPSHLLLPSTKANRGSPYTEWTEHPFVNHVKYLDIILDKRITSRLHTETIAPKAFRTFISAYTQFKSRCLSANIKVALHESLFRSIMTYACPA